LAGISKGGSVTGLEPATSGVTGREAGDDRRRVGGDALAATGVGASEALQVAVSIGVLGVLTGTAVLVAAIVWRSGTSLLPRASG